MELTIDSHSAHQRFDRFLRKFLKQYPQVSLTEIYKGIRTGLVKINGKKTKENYKLQEDDVVQFHDKFDLGKHKPNATKSIKEHRKERVNRDVISKRIIYEDDNWLVWNKPAGIVMHESHQHRKDLSMHDYLDEYVRIQGVNDEEHPTFKPSFGYRLDKDTSGVLIAAKTYNALQYINKIIRDRQVDKIYMTIVAGQFPQHLVINKALHKGFDEKFDRAHVVVRDDGKKSTTECRLEHKAYHDILGQISLVRVKITTGRMHQIRVHLADAKYPVLGDIVYGNPMVNRKLYKQCGISRQLLHCYQYSFVDMQGKQCSFQAPLPDAFGQIVPF